MPMSLESYRDEIDRVNADIIEKVAERMEIVEKIGRFKRENGIATVDSSRETEVVEQFKEEARENGMAPEVGKKVAETLIDVAREAQER